MWVETLLLGLKKGRREGVESEIKYYDSTELKQEGKDMLHDLYVSQNTEIKTRVLDG
jgi:hypothetical protein